MVEEGKSTLVAYLVGPGNEFADLPPEISQLVPTGSSRPIVFALTGKWTTINHYRAKNSRRKLLSKGWCLSRSVFPSIFYDLVRFLPSSRKSGTFCNSRYIDNYEFRFSNLIGLIEFKYNYVQLFIHFIIPNTYLLLHTHNKYTCLLLNTHIKY